MDTYHELPVFSDLPKDNYLTAICNSDFDSLFQCTRSVFSVRIENASNLHSGDPCVYAFQSRCLFSSSLKRSVSASISSSESPKTDDTLAEIDLEPDPSPVDPKSVMLLSSIRCGTIFPFSGVWKEKWAILSMDRMLLFRLQLPKPTPEEFYINSGDFEIVLEETKDIGKMIRLQSRSFGMLPDLQKGTVSNRDLRPGSPATLQGSIGSLESIRIRCPQEDNLLSWLNAFIHVKYRHCSTKDALHLLSKANAKDFLYVSPQIVFRLFRIICFGRPPSTRAIVTEGGKSQAFVSKMRLNAFQILLEILAGIDDFWSNHVSSGVKFVDGSDHSSPELHASAKCPVILHLLHYLPFDKNTDGFMDSDLMMPLHESLVETWVVFMHNRDNTKHSSIDEISLKYSWFLLGVIFKSMAVFVKLKKTSSESRHVFASGFQDIMEQFIVLLIRDIKAFSAKLLSTKLSESLTESLCLFIRDLFYVMPQHRVLRLVHEFVTAFGTEKTSQMRRKIFVLLRLIGEHEEYLYLSSRTNPHPSSFDSLVSRSSSPELMTFSYSLCSPEVLELLKSYPEGDPQAHVSLFHPKIASKVLTKKSFLAYLPTLFLQEVPLSSLQSSRFQMFQLMDNPDMHDVLLFACRCLRNIFLKIDFDEKFQIGHMKRILCSAYLPLVSECIKRYIVSIQDLIVF